MAADDSLARKWRIHCQQQPNRFPPLQGTPTARKKSERFEQQFIAQLDRAELPLGVRAEAFRRILELRRCTARDVATFFGVDPRVIVAGLSLLELPASRPLTVAPTTAVPQSIHSHYKAA